MATYDILKFGARGDGRTDNAAAIQRAIDECAEWGGGTVLVPAGGVYRSGAIVLQSNVELHVERGATLLASDAAADYPRALASDALSGGLLDEPDLPRRAFISAFDAEHVAIGGAGVIDGNGRAFVGADLGHIYRMRGERPHLERPFTVHLIGCRHVTVRDVTVRDGAFWTLRLTGCEDATISAVRIDNDRKLPNSAGLALDRCRDVRVRDCRIVAGDDAIGLKACRGSAAFGACEQITVSGCSLASSSAALKLGGESSGPIRDVVVDACTVRASHRGLAIHAGQGGEVADVRFSNITVETQLFHEDWWGRGEPIYLSTAPWGAPPGQIRRARFANILARSENGVLIHGWAGGPIEDLLLDQVRIEIDKWSAWPGGRQDLRPAPGEAQPAWPTNGLTLRNVDGVTLRGCELRWGPTRPDYFRRALDTAGVSGLRIEGFSGADAR